MTARATPLAGLAPPRRVDARRNYDRLVAAAREVFSESGLDASLDDIARRAGVGNATLYRHFPTRHALLEAAHRDQISSLCSLADELLETSAAADALGQWLLAVIDSTSVSRGLRAALWAASGGEDPALDWCQRAVFEAAGSLLAAATKATAAPADLSVGQLLKFVNAISLATEGEPASRDQARALLEIVLAGLAAKASPGASEQPVGRQPTRRARG